MESKLKDKTVLVTGGSRGIGKAIVHSFASAGARVIIHYNRNSVAAEETLAEITGDGHIIIQADLSDPDAVHDMVIGRESSTVHGLPEGMGAMGDPGTGQEARREVHQGRSLGD